MDPRTANPFKPPRERTDFPPVAVLGGGKPDHHNQGQDVWLPKTPPSMLAMDMAEVARREMAGYAHNGWCHVYPCSCRTAWLAARFDELMAKR